MIFETVAIIALILMALTVAFLIPTCLKFQRTLEEAQRLFSTVREELVPKMTAMTEEVRQLTAEARRGIGQASDVFQTIEEVGHQVHQIQQVVRERGRVMYTNARSLWAGLRAASAFLSAQVQHQKGEESNGNKSQQ